MKNNRLTETGIIFWLCCLANLAQSLEWPYEATYTADKLYIHSIANYDLHPDWHERWEQNLFRQNMLRLNFGSITSNELLSDARLVLNEELVRGVWFRYATTYYATQHRNEHEHSMLAGFETYIIRPLSLFVYGNPHFEKEEIDIHYGVSLSSRDRTSYIRTAFIDVDPFWDMKNDRHSQNLKRPWRLAWEMNMRIGAVRFFSQGHFENGTERLFVPSIPDDFNYQKKSVNDMIFKIYYYLDEKSFFEMNFSNYHFADEKQFLMPAFDYDYHNRIEHAKLGYVTPIGARFHLRCGSYAVFQESNSKKYNKHTYVRREIIPFIFGHVFIGPGMLEGGYIVSTYKWRYQRANELPDSHVKNYVDKIKLAYTFNMKDRVYLQIAISHVTTIWGFGGGNVQFWMQF